MPPPPRVKRKFIPIEERITTFKEPDFGYTREEAIEEANRCIQCKKPKCEEGCPASAPVKEYVTAIAEGDFETAYRLNRELLVLPCVLGRVCPAFCEQACILGKKFEPVAIRDLKRAACDYGKTWDPEVVGPKRDQKVAVIGAGPAGLTVANDLAIKGYQVVVFDRLDKPGGTLVAGIPTFRLPREIIDLDIEQLVDLGVEFRFGKELGKDFELDDLNYEGFDAIFLGIGAMAPKVLNITGEDLKGVASAATILSALAFGEEVDLPENISIIGCGNVAVDIARSAIRLDKKATILYRRTLKEAPANDDEIEEAFEEGVDIKYLVAPICILGDEEGVTAVECIQMELGEPDDSGRRRPIPVSGSEFSVPTDMVIPAVSQSPELDWLKKEDGLELTRWSTFWIDEEDGSTSRDNIFAAGDDVLGPSTVVEVITQAHIAAHGIHKFLSPEEWEAEHRKMEEPEEWPPKTDD